jgi:hypothetical protein
MDTVEPHPHAFADSVWPFSDPVNALAISTTRVFHENYPVLRVSHDYDGDWQVLCDTTVESRHGLVVCLGCCFQRDRTIGELADLPRGWIAWRDYVGGPWSREMKVPEDEDEA